MLFSQTRVGGVLRNSKSQRAPKGIAARGMRVWLGIFECMSPPLAQFVTSKRYLRMASRIITSKNLMVGLM